MPKLVSELPTFDIKALKPSAILSESQPQKFSWSSLVLVAVLHVSILMFVIHAQQKDKIDMPAAAPMMVSLLDAPQLQNEQPAQTPKVEIVKQKPVVEKRVIVPHTNVPSSVPLAQENINPIKQEIPVTESKPSTPQDQQVAESKSSESTEKSPQKEEVVEPPKFGVAYLNNPAPSYPPVSHRLSEQGQVMLRVLVSATGEATSVELEKSSQYERLDQAAITAVKKWRFVPAKKNNQALSAYVLVPVRFSIDK
ncbi:energy transducer TonB [Methyloradius palustris]|nr:energy transducer TonB [Methyloradius palustris]